MIYVISCVVGFIIIAKIQSNPNYMPRDFPQWDWAATKQILEEEEGKE